MRLVSGGAQGASLADHWAFMRDSGQRAASPCEVQAFADMVAPMPPSRAHIKRLQRNRPVVTTPRENVKLSQSPQEAFRRAQRGLLVDAGVLPADTGERPAYRPRVQEFVAGEAPRFGADMRKRYFDQCIAEAIRLAGIMRTTPFGPARREIKERATALLVKAARHAG